MEEEMSALIEKVIELSPPAAQGGLEAGKTALESELNKIFKPIRSLWFSEVLSQGRWEPVAAYKFVFKNKRLEEAFNRRQLDVLDKAFNPDGDAGTRVNFIEGAPMAEAHREQRGPDGRIVPDPKVFYIEEKRSLEEYMRQAARKIGTMVGGWYEALGKMGSGKKSPFPGKGAGNASFSQTPNNFTLVARNELGNFAGFLTKSVDPQALIDKAAANCQLRLQTIIDSSAKANPAPPKGGKMGKPSKPLPSPKAKNMASMLNPAAKSSNVAATAGKINPAAIRIGIINAVTQNYEAQAVACATEAISQAVSGQNISGAMFAQMDKTEKSNAELFNQLQSPGWAAATDDMLEGWKDD